MPQLRAAAALQLPVVVTEQYPKALGSTVEELQPHIPEGSPGAPRRTAPLTHSLTQPLGCAGPPLPPLPPLPRGALLRRSAACR